MMPTYSFFKDEKVELAYDVSTKGNNSYEGVAAETLFATIYEANRAIHSIKFERALKKPVTIYVQGGTNTLSEPLNLAAEDSGTEEKPIRNQAYKNKKSIIIGQWTEP